jgi:hypothetical protein
MIGKSNIVAAAFVSLVVAGTVAPQMAGAGEAERLQFQQCLADSALKPNETRARSECMWKHWSYMASYGP